MSELSGFVYIKNHVILHVRSKAVITLRIESVPPTESVINTNDKNTVLFTSSFDRSL